MRCVQKTNSREFLTDQTQLLRALRSVHGTQRRQIHTGQATVDKLLHAFVSPDLSHPRTDVSSEQHKVVRHAQGPVLELVGAVPCSGKTQLLYYLVGLSLLPPKHEDITLGGRGSAVILFDLGSSFSVLRLQKLMVSHVVSCSDKGSEPSSMSTILPIVQSSFEHLHVFRPQTSLSLIATLSNLHVYLFNTASHVSANRSVGSIILHDVDSFLWQDRLEDAEDQTIEANAPQKFGLLSSRFCDLVAHFRRLQAEFSCLVVATSSALSTTTYTRIDGQMVPVLRSHLPNIWRNFVTVRLIVQRDSVRKFPLGVSAEEAATEASQRREAVEKSGFAARLDWSESDVWKEETRTAIKGMVDLGELLFWITPSGVQFKTEA